MRVAFVIPHFPTQTHVFFWREIQELRARGVDVHVISPRRPPPAEVCHAWTPDAVASTSYVLPLTPAAVLRGLWVAATGLPRRAPDVWRRLRDTEPRGVGGWLRAFGVAALGAVVAAFARRAGAQHVHAHSCADVALLASCAAAWNDVPYSLTLHGPLEHYGGGQASKWGHAAFGVTVTQRLRREVLAAVPALPPGKVRVASMGVDVAQFRRRRPWEAPRAGEPWRLVTCGRLHRAKGHQDSVRAVGVLRDRGIDARLVVLGEGPDRPLVEQRVAELGLRDCVEMPGAVDADRVRGALEEAHAFVLGSHDEAIGVATMEAMAMELPVVVTDVGGVRELVREGIDGHLVPPCDSVAMADAVSRLIADPGRAAAMGVAGAERVRREFHAGISAEAIAAGVHEAAGNLVAARSPA